MTDLLISRAGDGRTQARTLAYFADRAFSTAPRPTSSDARVSPL
ncbi:hypothetical protein [Spongiactinospora sp. TRM90649]|nr:hypothetical protein [Spongiactinospora sp. TRM90649]MDF5752987.1 hypothetical protein [Spongiactinospora sp. TRM90649]